MEKIENNVGVFRGSAISALLFIIYLDDMMEDYTSLNLIENIPLRHAKEQDEEEMQTIMAEKIRQTYQNKTTQAQANIITQILKNLEQKTHLTIADKEKQKHLLYQYLEYPQPEPQGKITSIERSHQEYPDDTILLFNNADAKILTKQLNSYDTVTKSRKIIINWDKVEMLTKKK